MTDTSNWNDFDVNDKSTYPKRGTFVMVLDKDGDVTPNAYITERADRFGNNKVLFFNEKGHRAEGVHIVKWCYHPD